MNKVLGSSCLCTFASLSKRLIAILGGSASPAGANVLDKMKQLAASMSAMQLKSPSDSVQIGASFNLNTSQAALTL